MTQADQASPDVREVLEAWCLEKASALTKRSSAFVMAGGDLNDPEYRRLLGKHQAFMEMRSFLSGARKAALRAKGPT